MYTQLNQSIQGDENKFRFVQTTARKAYSNAGFETVLKAQQDAQRKFSSVDRNHTRAVWNAYNQLSLSTAKMLEFYLQCSSWSTKHYMPLIGSQLQKYGLDARVVDTLNTL